MTLNLKLHQKNLKNDTKQRFVNVSANNFDPLYHHQMLMGFLFILIRVFENISNIKNMFNKSVIRNIQNKIQNLCVIQKLQMMNVFKLQNYKTKIKIKTPYSPLQVWKEK